MCVFIAFAIMLISSVVLFEKWYVSLTVSYPIEQAQKAYKQNQYDDAISILERLDAAHPLNKQQRALLNDIYWTKAEFLTAKKILPTALSTLARISHDYNKIAVVEQRRCKLLQLMEQSKRLESKSKQSKNEHALLVDKQPSRTTPNEIVPVSAVTPISTRATSQSRLLPTGIASTPAISSANEPTFATVTRMLSVSIVGSQSTAGTEPHRIKARQTREPSKWSSKSHLAEKDGVRYNELLAEYFSRPSKNSEVQAEPPSLNEWIEQGKPNF